MQLASLNLMESAFAVIFAVQSKLEIALLLWEAKSVFHRTPIFRIVMAALVE